jgi:hypothetical protein
MVSSDITTIRRRLRSAAFKFAVIIEPAGSCHRELPDGGPLARIPGSGCPGVSLTRRVRLGLSLETPVALYRRRFSI